MGTSRPFNVDAALHTDADFAKLPPQGGAVIGSFCGIGTADHDWDVRGACVVKSRRGFGKSHILGARSFRHRASAQSAKTFFHPRSGQGRMLFDSLSALNAVVPRWLRGREAAAAWCDVWQLAILGLLVWQTGARTEKLRGFDDWFGSLDDLVQTQRDNQTDPADAATFNVILSWFVERVIEGLPADDFVLGCDMLKGGMNRAGSDWSIAIGASLSRLQKSRIAMYLDAPDELVPLDRPHLWTCVQQGLLLAIWKFSKNTFWSSTLNIYASVRSEAFGSGQDHPDIALALGLAMPLHYSRDDLKAILGAKILAADIPWLKDAIANGQEPIHALCGFSDVSHDKRRGPDGVAIVEGVFDSILRHTRMIPREVVAIGAAIYALGESRTIDTVRESVNAQASSNIADAIQHSFLGWSDALHRSVALVLPGEVMEGNDLAKRMAALGVEGQQVVKFFIKHGMLGYAERQPRRHRHYYVQRFAFDEVGAGADSISMERDFFFLHPALKEWVLSRPDRVGSPLQRLASNVIGDGKAFESKPPLVHLSIHDGKVSLKFRVGNQLLQPRSKGRTAIWWQVLFVALCVLRKHRLRRITLHQLEAVWSWIQKDATRGGALRGSMLLRGDDAADRLRNWAKKINQESVIKMLQHSLRQPSKNRSSGTDKGASGASSKAPFLSINAAIDMKEVVILSFPNLPSNDVDWDDFLDRLMMQLPGSSPQAI